MKTDWTKLLIVALAAIIAGWTVLFIAGSSDYGSSVASSFRSWQRHDSRGGNSSTPAPTPVPAPTPKPVSTPVPPIVVVPVAPTSTPVIAGTLQWGAYVGDGSSDLSNFESLVGNKINILADFEGWNNTFPSGYASTVGAQSKTLVVFWEPSFGYSTITSGVYDTYIKQFAAAAKTYGYPVILVPFDEMNLNEEAWGYGQNGNTPANFKAAWDHIHDLFVAAGASNVKFGIAYNNVSVPNIAGNQFSDYYPGTSYVDYVGVDGFNFGNPWQSFDQVFDTAIAGLQAYNKPIYIFSMGSTAGPNKAAWISEGLGTHIKTYANVVGWIWFNSDSDADWLINSDANSLAAFKAIIP